MASPAKAWTLTARWILPMDAPPLANGTVTVAGERLVAVEPSRCRNPDLDLGNSAVIPGLVNAHTHLDLTGLRGRVPPGGEFTDWLRAVIRHRRNLSAAQIESDICTGLAESLARGTTLLGDISAQGLSWPVLAESPVRSIVFYELLGLTPMNALQAWATCCDWLGSHAGTPNCRPGLSPHAPYSVRRSLLRAAALESQQQQLPLTIHLAESRAEQELLEYHRGPFVPFLTELGVWDPAGLVNNWDEALELTGAANPVLLAHGNYLDPAVPLPSGTTVVYCPRTHAAFGHEPHHFRQFLAAGVPVAIGTDSLASNPDLDVLAELRFLRRSFADVPGSVLLCMGTLNGAVALGWDAETGSLTVGKSADLAVVPLPSQEDDPYELVLQSDLPVCGVLCRGQWYRPVN
jgi:cytosine/adenosine deaminase-related metal-dependent hydrolase